MMPLYPQAYFISWGTYGARLTGGAKPYVDRWHNEYGAPLPPPDLAREDAARERMTDSTISLTLEHRIEVERAIREVAERYNWTIRVIAIQSNHSHVVLTAPRDGNELRDALKAVASRALNKKFEKRTWWAEGGRSKYLWEGSYFENAVDYVRRQRDF
jgi:REP element-mobilizing transposase RayT